MELSGFYSVVIVERMWPVRWSPYMSRAGTVYWIKQ
jgi:hypothetical protein